jgi:hypothetical protein
MARNFILQPSQVGGIYGLTIGLAGDSRLVRGGPPFHITSESTIYGSLDDLRKLALAIVEDIDAIEAEESLLDADEATL